MKCVEVHKIHRYCWTINAELCCSTWVGGSLRAGRDRVPWFKLGKLLDLESFNIDGTSRSEIQSLIHIRYFADQTNASSTPSFIAKLWNLEPFGITGLKWRSHITYFPSRFQRLTIMEAVESLV
ncbi:hypothetical protein H5410_034401 [Solanum commersonii]|uniref:Uncharacterized protein n=1 Tax=Solanum commersonii TaxID=4109 RepID=A0A9J5YTA4_SOLCO|nr:hypothetical protein H5410_034401 [Solanum commersonii]